MSDNNIKKSDPHCRLINNREMFCDFDAATIWGGPHIHAILCIDPVMLDNQLPSLMLFLSQLIDGAKGEGKLLDISIHIKGKDTPIKLLNIHEGDGEPEGTIDDLLSYLFEASLGIVGGTILEGKKNAFSLKDLAELDRYEASVQYPRGEENIHEIVFVFEPEKFGFTEVPENRDLVGVTFRSDRAAYPYEFTKVKSGPETEALVNGFKPVTPCTMQGEYAYLFGQYYEENGLPILKRLFEAPNLRLPFVFKHSLSEFIRHKGVVHDASLCSAEDALKTAISAYFWYDYNEVDPFGFFLHIRPSPVLQSLMLFVDGENGHPETAEISALTSGYYEMLVELAERGDEKAGDKKAAAFFIHSVLTLYYDYAYQRAANNDRQSKIPTPEVTFAEYLKRLNALPSDFIEAFVGITTSPELLAKGKDSLRYMIAHNEGRPEFKQMFDQFIIKALMTMADNFKSLSDDEKAKEVKRVLSWCSGYIKDIIYNPKQNLDSFGIFLDVMYEALKDEPELKRLFTSTLVAILTNIDQKEICTPDDYLGHNFYYIVSYLHKKGVLDPGDAKRLVEWTLTFDKLEEYMVGRKMLYQVVSTWVDMWGYLTEKDRVALSDALSKKSPELMDKIVEWTNFTQRELQENGELKFEWGDDHEEYTFHPRDGRIDIPNESMITGVSSILDARQLVRVVAGIIDNEHISEYEKGYIRDAIHAAHHYKKGTDWLEFVCYLTFATPNSYKALDDILEASKDDEERRLTLMAVHTGLVKHDDSWPSFYEDAWENEGLLLLVESILKEDIKGFVEWFEMERDYGTGPHISAYFTKGFKTKIITEVLTLAKDESEQELFWNFSRTFFWNDSGLISEGYDPKIHDPLFLNLFEQMVVGPVLKGEPIDDIGNFESISHFIKVLFAGFAPETKKRLIEGLIASIKQKFAKISDDDDFWLVRLFYDTLEQINDATTLTFTRPFFDIAFEGIESERLGSDHGTVGLFLKKWEKFIGEYDADTRCAILADMLGRFPAALTVNEIDIEGLFTKVLMDDAQKVLIKSTVVEIKSEEELKAQLSGLKSGQTAVVVFSAPWCPACKNLRPAFEELSGGGNDKYVYIWVEDEELLKKYQISGIPHIVTMDSKGEITGTVEQAAIYKGTKGAPQDPAIAFKLGAYMADNPYAPIVPRFFDKFLTPTIYAEIVKGFVLEVSKGGYSSLKPKDIRSFLTATNYIFYKLYKTDYFAFALNMMESEIPDHLIIYFLFPMRNEYLSLIKGFTGELGAQMEGLMMIAGFFERAFEDEAVPAERKKYLYKCFKQIEADLADGFFSKIPQISDEIKGVKERFRHLEERFKAYLVEGKH